MAQKPATWLAFSILLYVFLLHTSTLYIFIRGFLLTRLSLPNISSCDTCTLPRTHSRMVFLIVDALRFDFISPQPAITPSPHYHNVLTLPAQLTEKHPEHSFLFNSFSDPPTATLQRIKGITTGSIPTFVDMGSSFAASQISEDSLLLQMQRAGKKMAFMGDDTWTTVYPTTFSHNMSFPYDSFNVEDLHSVDEGITRHLFPLLNAHVSEGGAPLEWDLLIGHFLGVDHVGHRLGPAHPTMKQKLKQMNDILTRVVDSIDNDTLLVVIGDHGMDRKGDHGGDGQHETSAATWIYSKSTPLSDKHFSVPAALVPTITFPDAPVAHRSIQQIDLVPTLSLLLGLPIPFNNLGTVIPELFGNRDTLEQALRLNAEQIKSFFDAYRDSPSGGELNSVWRDIEHSWQSIRGGDKEQTILAMHDFTRFALSSCRSLWAKFNIVLMYVGLSSLLLGSATTWALYASTGRGVKYWKTNGWPIIIRAGLASITGGGLGWIFWLFLPFFKRYFDPIEAILAGAALASSIIVLSAIVFKRHFHLAISRPSIILSIHSLAFFSNSFTFWEDRMLTFLLVTCLVPFIINALMHPQVERRLRNRILGFSAVFALCIRLASISTVCREEQHPYCHVTFYGSSMQSAPPVLAYILCIPVSYALSNIMQRFLAISASDKGPAQAFITRGFRTVMVAGNAYWIMEALDAGTSLRDFRTYTSMFGLGLPLTMGYITWWYLPLCLELRATEEQTIKKHELIGFANSYGSSFLLFVLISFSVVYYTSQLAGQVALALCLVALLALLEVIDSARDVQSTIACTEHRNDESKCMVPKVAFSEIVPVSLLALQAFYSTGHQSTLSSIQWKSAFLLTSTVTYPTSPILVFINFFGSLLIFAIAIPLLAVWKVDPLSEVKAGASNKPLPGSHVKIERASHSPHVLLSALRAALGMSLYFSILLLSSAASSAWLRRHLMVWKVFAPRFMMAGVAALVVDLGVLISVPLAVGRVVKKVDVYFKPLLQKVS